jgi:integrase
VKLEVKLVNEKLAHARGGEVVLYKRGDSARWQARYKLKDLKWHRTATKQANLQYAAEVACEAYDRARFLFAENIAMLEHHFNNLTATLAEGSLA